MSQMINDTVSFPNLFSGDLTVNRVIFSVFGIDIYWYGVLITIGVILGFLYAMKRSKSMGMLADNVFDVAFIGTIGGFVGARAYYCIFHNLNPDTSFKYTFITAITQIRDGGLAIYGGIIGAIICAALYAKIKKIHILPILDLAGLGFLIGQGIGRWGNFFNQECYGAPTAGSLPWGMTGNKIAADPAVIAAGTGGEALLVHPCFLYEFLWCALGFLLLHFYSKKLRSFDGEIFLLYIIWYGFGRGFIEGLRMDSLYAGSLKVSQVIGLASSVFGIIVFIYLKLSLKKNKNYKMYVQTDDSIASFGEYEKSLVLQKEKLAAKKAMKETEQIKQNKASSVLGDREENNNETEKK